MSFCYNDLDVWPSTLIFFVFFLKNEKKANLSKSTSKPPLAKKLKADGGKEVAKTGDSNSGDSDVNKDKKLKSAKNENSRKLTAALRSATATATATAPTVPPRRWRTSRSDASRPKKSRFLKKACATTRTRTLTPGARRPTRIWSWRRGKDFEAKRRRRRGEAIAGVPSTLEWLRSDLIMIVTKQFTNYYMKNKIFVCIPKMRSVWYCLRGLV